MTVALVCGVLAAAAVAVSIPPSGASVLSRRLAGRSAPAPPTGTGAGAAPGATTEVAGSPPRLVGRGFDGARPAGAEPAGPGRAGPGLTGRWPPPRVVLVAVASVIGVVAVVAIPRLGWSGHLPPATAGLAVLAAGAGLGIRLVRRSRAAARCREANRAAVRRAVGDLAGELRAGRDPSRGLAAVAAEVAMLRPAAAVAAMGGDVPAALRTAARADGAADLTRLAAAWSVAEQTGTGLAAVLESLGEGLHRDDEIRAEVAAQLAAPRMTARLLALLPVGGLALGSGIGSHPVRILLATPYGLGCLVLGGGLAAAGLCWVEALSRGAEEAG